jgi:hypothetical protein
MPKLSLYDYIPVLFIAGLGGVLSLISWTVGMLFNVDPFVIYSILTSLIIINVVLQYTDKFKEAVE